MVRDRAAAGRRCILSGLIVAMAASLAAAAPPNDFPQFIVPGQEQFCRSLRDLFWLHYEPAGPLLPLWDEWMPQSTLWPARGADGSAERAAMRQRWADALAGRTLNAEGYVHTRQHDGPAHAEGWPFPFWSHAGGVGWHFAPIGVPGYEAPLATVEGWEFTGARAASMSGV
jgi:hypothetical protein